MIETLKETLEYLIKNDLPCSEVKLAIYLIESGVI